MTTKSITNNRRVWFITGCSTGFGQAITRAVLEDGECAFITARNLDQVEHFLSAFPDTCKTHRLDVLDNISVMQAVGAALAWKSQIDVLVNNAGYGLVGAVEEVDENEATGIFETNVFGLLRVTRAVLPAMRGRGTGHIVNISSMGGLVSFAGMGLYSASKFAVEGLSEALALEVRPLGINVTIVEPGPFRTKFRGGLQHAATSIVDYAQTAGKVREAMADLSVKQPGDPDLAARVILAAVRAKNPPLRLPLGQLCYDKVFAKMDSMRAEMGEWKPSAVATAFPD